jgi:hypothetical protein
MTYRGITDHAMEVVKTTHCPRCDSEAGYHCTYVPPATKNQHKATTAARKALMARVGTQTKQPHSERFAAFRRWQEREARRKHQEVLAQQKAAKEEALRVAWRKTHETKLAYAEFGRREALDLAEWLRKNHSIFRIDETF